MTDLDKEIMELIEQYGGIQGSHHKQWVLDQIARKIEGPKYPDWVKAYCTGEEGPDTYEWEEGIAP